MARDKLTEYDATAANNTVVGDVNLAENSALPSDMNNAVRELMSHLKAFASGTDAIDALTVTGAATVSGAFTSPGIDDNADATAITITSSENIGVANTTPDSFSQNGSQRLVVGSGSGTQGLTIYAGNASHSAISFADGTIGTAQYAGFLNYNHNLDVLQVGIFGSERARFTVNGLTFNGDTAAANALDDYEEGTWTPVLRAETSNLTATYIEQVGRYVRVGKLVHVQCRMQGSVTNAGSGARFIDGLPYTNVNAGADTGSGSVCPFNGLMGNNYYFATGHGVNNAASFRLKIQTNLDGTLSDISSGTGGFAIDFSYTYRSQS